MIYGTNQNTNWISDRPSQRVLLISNYLLGISYFYLDTLKMIPYVFRTMQQACLLQFARGSGGDVCGLDAAAAANPGSDALRVQTHQSETELSHRYVFFPITQ